MFSFYIVQNRISVPIGGLQFRKLLVVFVKNKNITIKFPDKCGGIVILNKTACSFVVFDGIPNFVGYFMPNPCF